MCVLGAIPHPHFRYRIVMATRLKSKLSMISLMCSHCVLVIILLDKWVDDDHGSITEVHTTGDAPWLNTAVSVAVDYRQLA